MDQPPPPTTTTAVLNHHYQDSLESSSVSSPTCSQWDDTLPPPKLRMMCSFGGHIIPRPHDKSLCYMGGETRIVVADRHTSLADLCSRLSTTLLHGRQFTLKYQLPSEDLDSLVSVSTDEDLDNMVEEYDRLNASNPSLKPARLRLFLFLSKPETAASMGSLLDDAKSETWFVDALNGAGLLPRGLSDSAPIDNLLEHKDGAVQEDGDSYTESEINRRRLDVQLINLPDSPLVETTSSFGSSSSSPSMSNLPPIKVRMDQMNQMAGLDEQLSQLNVNAPPPPVPVNNVGGWAAVVTSGGGGTVSDDERSDHGAPGGGMRKPPLPLQPVQRKFGHDAYSLASPDSKHGGAYGIHSPDSIASDSDSSIASANCKSKPAFSHDPNLSSNRDTGTPPATTQVYPNTTTTATPMTYQIPIQQIPDYADSQQPPRQLNQDQQQQQQQFYQSRPHYIHHPSPNQPPPPGSSYYPVYAPPQQIDHQQYPLYFLPVSQNHHYGMQMQPNQTDAGAATNSTTINPSSGAVPPLYPTKTAAPTQGMIQIPSNQFQQQYVNVSQIPNHHPPTPLPTSNGGKYGYEYGQPGQDQVYYSNNHHSVAAPLPSQYQTMTPASAMLLAQASSAQQPLPESAKQ